jgi:hypothetical protein
MEYKCEECKDTKKIMVEGVKLGRQFYSKKLKKVITPYETDSKWQLTECYCVVEEIMTKKPKNYHEDCDFHIVDDNDNCSGCEYKRYIENIINEITLLEIK